MTPKTDETLNGKELYIENGRNYRFFLNWRHALFAGYLGILFLLGKAYSWIVENQYQMLWVIYLFGLIITLCIWGLDRRNRELYRSCLRIGKNLEKDYGLKGIYSRLDTGDKEDINDLPKITHSKILDIFFGIITLTFLILIPLYFCSCYLNLVR